MFLYLGEVALLTVVFLIVITQILYPLIRDTKTFPLFRKEGKLTEKLADINQKIVEKGIETEITNKKRRL